MTILPRLKQDVVDAAAADRSRSVPSEVPTARIVGARGRRRRRSLLTATTALVGAAAIVVLLVPAATAPPPAYALVSNWDGTVTVTLHDVAAATAPVNAKLARLGIDERVVPITSRCATSAPVVVSAGGLSRSLTLSAGRRYLLPGWRGVLAAKQLSGGKVALIFGAVQGPPPRCFSATGMSNRVLGYRHRTPPTRRQASSIDRQTLLLAKEVTMAFNTSHN